MAAAREAQRAAAQRRWESRQAHAYTNAQRQAALAGPLAPAAGAAAPFVEDYAPLGHPAASPAAGPHTA
eukprot:15466797-Alexandrium_andersonii.AAC.1